MTEKYTESFAGEESVNPSVNAKKEDKSQINEDVSVAIKETEEKEWWLPTF